MSKDILTILAFTAIIVTIFLVKWLLDTETGW